MVWVSLLAQQLLNWGFNPTKGKKVFLPVTRWLSLVSIKQIKGYQELRLFRCIRINGWFKRPKIVHWECVIPILQVDLDVPWPAWVILNHWCVPAGSPWGNPETVTIPKYFLNKSKQYTPRCFVYSNDSTGKQTLERVKVHDIFTIFGDHGLECTSFNPYLWEKLGRSNPLQVSNCNLLLLRRCVNFRAQDRFPPLPLRTDL